MSSLRHAAGALLGALIFVAAVLFLIVRLVIPPPPPCHVPVPAPLGPALTQHLVLVIVDGLRYDVARDPALMPNVSRRMAESRSGEIWSGAVSMTSSAILTIGTGQRGDVEQIIKNESGTPVAHNDLIKNAKDAGLVTACAGDRTWFRLYPQRWTLGHPDPYGLAIDVDYNAEIFAAAREFLRATPRPNFTIYHFVTPDHQAHAYGVYSEKYRTHIRGFDKELEALLGEIPADTTVIVTSDHGAAASGTHGTDTPEQRRSPIFALGPGIAKGSASRRLDQIDLPGTMAALLGVPPPAHGRGHVFVDWLDVDEERRATIACADVARLSTLANASGASFEAGAEEACKQGDPRARIEAASVAAARLDRAIGDVGATSRFAWLAPPFIVLAALALAGWALRGDVRFGKASLVGLGLVVFAIATVYTIERLPGRFPDIVRAIGYIGINGALVLAVVRRRAAAALVDNRPLLGALLVPGLVVVSETKTTQPESFALATVFLFFALLVGLPRTHGAPPASFSRAPWPRLVAALLLLVALAPIGFRENGFLPRAIESSPNALFALAAASIALFALLGRRAEPTVSPNPFMQAGLVVIAVASLWMRRVAPAPICLAGWLGLGAAAVLLAFRDGKRAYVELLALGSYAWVSRDAEIPLLVATYTIARFFGDAVRGEGEEEGPLAPSLVFSIVTFLFAWTYVQRVAVQLGLDFVSMDWGAGAFRQEGTSFFRIAFGIFYKHGLARAGILAAVLVPLAPRLRVACVKGIFLCELTRATMLAAMLYVCRDSFWTALRVVSDAPHALSALIVTAFAYVAVAASARAKPHPELSPAAA